jgi:aminoglycoside/choline kinase family phosphotransferase
MSPSLESLIRSVVPDAASISPLPADGSSRRRWRVRHDSGTCIATLGDDPAENRAFIVIGRHLASKGIPVPAILAVAPDESCYLEEDLGDTTLFKLLSQGRALTGTNVVSEAARASYLATVRWLPAIQTKGASGLDWSFCFPRAAFDRQSITWDLNYFKYYFLRPSRVCFHEQALENDFATLCDAIENLPSDFFLYRDFQSRNVMIQHGGPRFIDFQGGRRGPRAYDLASLILDAKADLPQDFRDELVNAYLEAAGGGSIEALRAELNLCSLVRILQALGAYGYRGFFERKEHFLQSVPFALRNLAQILDTWRDGPRLPALEAALRALIAYPDFAAPPKSTGNLNIRLSSFSYKKGLPGDDSGHGGGYVFDCRLLPNPGRDPALAPLTGRDVAVAAMLAGSREVRLFLERTRTLVGASVSAYQARGFDHLSVSFGCTGGRHRSVYCAEQLAAWLRTLPGVSVTLIHRDIAA